MQKDYILRSTDSRIMGEWRNGGIERKTIALGIVTTIRDDNLEGMHPRRRRSNRAH